MAKKKAAKKLVKKTSPKRKVVKRKRKYVKVNKYWKLTPEGRGRYKAKMRALRLKRVGAKKKALAAKAKRRKK